MIGTIVTHKLRKYSETDQLPPLPAEHDRTFRLNPALAYSSPLCAALTAYADVAVARLGVFAAFVSLTDGHTQQLLAGSWEDKGEQADACWLGATEDDYAQWLWLGQQTLDLNSGTDDTDRVFTLQLAQDPHTKRLSSVAGSPSLAYYAAAPITTEFGTNIGTFFIVDNAARRDCSRQDKEFLLSTAAKCMAQLVMAREAFLRQRAMKMNNCLTDFLNARAIHAQILEDPPALHPSDRINEQHDHAHGEPNNDLDEPAKDVVRSELEHGPPRDTSGNPDMIAGRSDTEVTSSHERGETTYRKVFRRAAEGLRKALDVDGAVFVDGQVGFHGALIPVAEPEQALEEELAQEPEAKTAIGSQDQGIEHGKKEKDDTKNGDPHSTTECRSGDKAKRGERTFTSADYQKHVLSKRPAEILGISMRSPDAKPATKDISKTTLGLDRLHEEFLQLILANHYTGRVWYFDEEGNPFFWSNDKLTPDDRNDESMHIASIFPGVRQLIFIPLTDSVTLKRLAGCFAWTSRVYPVFTDTMDLGPFKSFLHCVEAEISRIDTVAAVKQQETFVSSVSHELRTPLHGILGAVEFLSETQLDTFQQGLAESIRSCGSTLHDTLSSVLSYAKINQIERRRNKPKQWGAKESPWALENKDVSGGPERDIQGVFSSANIATLCEEVVEVTTGGHAYSRTASTGDVTVTLDVAWRENWNFMTEPGALRRVMINIIGNALKYTEKGYVNVALSLEKTQDTDDAGGSEPENAWFVVFSVTDSGKGMSRQFLEKRLFNPFTQEDTVASAGVGLGMSIVKSLVALLGGKVNVSSQPGKGSTFTVIIPMTEGSPQAPSPAAAALEKAIPDLRNRSLDVAICGFDPHLRRTLERYLRDWYHCTILSSDEEIVHPDILLIDQTNRSFFDDIRIRYNPDRLALLSISNSPSLQSRSSAFQSLDQGYKFRQVVSRPIGPHKLSKALLSCTDYLAATLKTGGLPNGEKVGRLDELVNPFQTEERAIEPPRHFTSPTSQATIPLSNSKIQTTPSADEAAAQAAQLERSAQPPAVISNRPSAASARSSASEARVPRLLLVEDNAVNLKLLKTFMLKQGYTDPTTAENGVLAVEAVERCSEGFDIIFMDISMPIMDGYEATRTIRSIERRRLVAASRALPEGHQHPAFIVALTGLASAKDEENAYRSGIDMVITKPVKFKRLAELFEQWKRGELKGGGAGEGG